mgnify:FL=1
MLSKLLDGFLLQSYYEHMNSCSYVHVFILKHTGCFVNIPCLKICTKEIDQNCTFCRIFRVLRHASPPFSSSAAADARRQVSVSLRYAGYISVLFIFVLFFLNYHLSNDCK